MAAHLLSPAERARLLRGAELAREDMEEAETNTQERAARIQYRQCMSALDADNRARQALGAEQ